MPQAKTKASPKPKKQEVKKQGRFRFFRNIWDELHKVTWLSRRELLYLTGLVLLLTLTLGLVLGGLDYGLSSLVQNFLVE